MIITRAMPTQQTAITGVSRRITAGQEIKAELCRGPGLKPGRVKGRTVIPLTRQPDGMQAWKIIIPTSNVTPEPRTHNGDEWIYVLSGHMRFVLGDQDMVLGPAKSPHSTPRCRTG